jgi:sugar phosphate isomerase/epimerase
MQQTNVAEFDGAKMLSVENIEKNVLLREEKSVESEWPLSYILYHAFRVSDREKEVESALKTLSKLGYKGVELPDLFYFETVEELKAFVKQAKSYGLEVSEVKYARDFVVLDDDFRKDIINDTKEKIKFAEGAEIDMIQVFTGPMPWMAGSPRIGKDISEGKAWSLVFEAFNEITDAAEKCNVYLTIEAVYDMVVRDYYTLKELLDTVKSKYLVVNFDPIHYHLYRNDIPWVVRRLGKLIKHVHLHDGAGRPGEPREDNIWTLLGEGTVDWEGMLVALREIGYKGFLSMEIESKWLYDVMEYDFETIANINKQSLEKLISHTLKQ